LKGCASLPSQWSAEALAMASCLNLSVMNFAIRLIVLSSLAICYLAAILIFNQVLLRV
jgi:hypothetical protein